MSTYGDEREGYRKLPYRTRVGRPDLCGIRGTRLACLVRRDGAADRNTSRSG